MNNQQKRGMLMVVIGLCMVLTAMGIHLSQEQQDAIAGESAQILLNHLDLSRSAIPAAVTEPVQEPGEEVPAPSQAIDMATKVYMGFEMIGTIQIPSVHIHLPILSSWSYELLDVAPCRYTGSIPQGNLTIMGHNYKSHFTPLHNVTVGDKVEFTDVNGQVYRYCVAAIEYLWGNEEDQLASDYPLTLFTCTNGGQKRVIIRCDAE